ncbi:hypothetical protein G6F56_006844 [Rhizopus delemar]|nr:hypothetical protein G6F56_006844 [Rhizopus delemar]
MSHFRFPRTTRPIEQELMDTVIHPMEHQQHELEEVGSVHSESSSDSTILAPRPPVSERRCWICFGDSSDSQGKWVRCPQCSASYHLAQRNSITLALFTLIDSLVRTTAPYVTVLGLGCSVLITCTTFGAYTVMIMFGHKEGERLIGNPNGWTWKTWIGLPLIPVMLISTKTRWGNFILPFAAASFLRATHHQPQIDWFQWSPVALTYGVIPWFCVLYRNAYAYTQRYLTRTLSLQETENTNQSSRRRSGDISDRERHLELDMIQGRGSTGLSLIGALLWPTFSSLMGGLLYKSKWIRRYFPETFQRNVLGGCLFVVAKDIGNLVYKYERIRQYRSRRVKSYEEVHQHRHHHRHV